MTSPCSAARATDCPRSCASSATVSSAAIQGSVEKNTVLFYLRFLTEGHSGTGHRDIWAPLWGSEIVELNIFTKGMWKRLIFQSEIWRPHCTLPRSPLQGGKKQLLVLWNSTWIHFSFVSMVLRKVIQREQREKILLLWFFYISKLTWMVSGTAVIRIRSVGDRVIIKYL